MKLAEALIERAEIQKRNGQLIKRIKDNTQIQDGDSPPEKPEELIAEYEGNMTRFLELVQRINDTNCKTLFGEDDSVADAIAQRDCMGAKIKAYREIYESATIRPDRRSRNEIKFVRCIDAKELQGQINRLSKEYREIDTKLQGINWTIDLI
jgi:hypothetical protein